MITSHRKCPGCGYDLYGLTPPCKCPECGRLIAPPRQVSKKPPKNPRRQIPQFRRLLRERERELRTAYLYWLVPAMASVVAYALDWRRWPIVFLIVAVVMVVRHLTARADQERLVTRIAEATAQLKSPPVAPGATDIAGTPPVGATGAGDGSEK